MTVIKPRAIPFGEIAWQKPEWASEDSEALVASVEGFEFEIGRCPDHRRKWDWAVKATAAVSETPELIVSGSAASKSGAQYGCKEQFNQYRLREYKRERAAAAEAKPERKAEPKPEAKQIREAKSAAKAAAKRPKKTAAQILADVEEKVAA